MSESNSQRMDELRDLVRRCFAQTLMLDETEIGDSADFFEDLGGDSLDSLDCAVRLWRSAASPCRRSPSPSAAASRTRLG